MDKNIERHSAANDLLSQSYCNGIQKIAGTDDAITSDFHISGKLLVKRKKAWNNLFEKYSSMVSEVELNINTLQPEEPMNPPEATEQRLPMRKPMSMVQYWVDTGNLLHMNCTNNDIHSDSGSSIIEDDCCEPVQNNDSQSLATNLSAEKNSNIAETSGNKNLKIATSSNSSIDTAAYILANNNITKKAETIAIVEGSKVVNEIHSPVKANNNITKKAKAETIAIVEGSKVVNETHSPVKANNNISKKAETMAIIEGSKVVNETHNPIKENNVTKKAENIATVEGSKVDTKANSPVKHSLQIVEKTRNTNKISSTKKSNHDKLKVANTDLPLPFFYKSYADKITENLKNAKLDKMSENKKKSKSKSQQSHICSIFFSESDESISNIQNDKFQNVFNENNQNTNNVSKFSKRKKLYKRSDSPAEFTPVSEDNLSLHTSKLTLRKCLPLTKSEHPALNTPKTSSTSLSRTRYRRTKFKRKLNRCQGLPSVTTSDEKSENEELLDSNQNNVNSCSLYNSQIQNTRNPSDIQTGSKENCMTNNNLMLNPKSSDNHNKTEEGNVQNNINRTSSFSSCNDLFKNKLELKSCKIIVQRLPYRYYSSNGNVTKKKNLLDSVKSKKIKDVNKNLRNYALTSNIVSINNENDLSNVKANNVTTFNYTKTFGDILKGKEKKSLQTTRSNYSSSDGHSTEKISVKHVEMTDNESLYKEKSKYMIADSTSDESDLVVTSIKNKYVSKYRKSKKLPGKHFYLDECSNTTNEDSNESCSNKRKKIMRKMRKNNDTDDDLQCFETKENSFSLESRHKISSRDGKNNKNKIKSSLDASSCSKEEEEISTPVEEKNQAMYPAIEGKKTIESICAISSESRNTSRSLRSCRLLVNRIEETNNNIDVNNKLAKLTNEHSKTETLGKMRNESELRVDDKSFSSDNSGDVGTVSNSSSDKKLPNKIPADSHAKNSRNIQSNKSSPTKQTQRGDKSQKRQDSTKVKTAIIQKTSARKRKSLEIDLSSEEECIIPLKKKE